MKSKKQGMTKSQFMAEMEKRITKQDRIISYKIVVQDLKNEIIITNKEE